MKDFSSDVPNILRSGPPTGEAAVAQRALLPVAAAAARSESPRLKPHTAQNPPSTLRAGDDRRVQAAQAAPKVGILAAFKRRPQQVHVLLGECLRLRNLLEVLRHVCRRRAGHHRVHSVHFEWKAVPEDAETFVVWHT